jgi:hypothetical protein
LSDHPVQYRRLNRRCLNRCVGSTNDSFSLAAGSMMSVKPVKSHFTRRFNQCSYTVLTLALFFVFASVDILTWDFEGRTSICKNLKSAPIHPTSGRLSRSYIIFFKIILKMRGKKLQAPKCDTKYIYTLWVLYDQTNGYMSL